MGLSYTEEMRRQRRRIISANEKIAEHQSAKLELDRAISDLLDDVKSAEARIAEADARKAARVKFRFERIRTPVGELSKKRYVRVRQALHRVCDEEGIVAPAWVNAISDADIRFARREDLLERYVLSDGGIATAFDTDRRRAIADKLCDILKIESDPSEKLDDLRAVNPAFNYERALDIVIAGRAEFGVTDERGASARERHLLASTAWMRCVVRGDWIEDSASRLAARVGHDGGPKSLDSMKPPDGMKTGKLAAAIELSVNREKARSFAHEENDARLMQAVAIFATPGAMAAAARRGLSAEQRIFCAEWFAANRDLATQLGYRVGTEALFAELEKDSGLFRARYGAAPKFAPSSRIWAREKTDVGFDGVPPIELIEQARHALIDLSLHAHLVSLPKNRDAFLRLGAYEGAELLHGEFVDVGQWVSKAFLAEARDAAEVQVLQGTNPLAMTAGLVTWKSGDGVERQAPLFLAISELDEATKTIHRLSDFRLNRALLRRIALDYPALPGSGDSFDALLGDVVFASPLGALFERVVAAINVGAPVGGKPILKIEDVCLIGSFDSARSVLERRLNLKAFPDLVENPVVRLLALGAKATGRDQIIEGQFDPKGARSRPDKIQALAVKASLGGTSFVLEGPPGTGKTQTIVAMVEALAKQGKRVLVSAAMPGAVGVIHRRLHGVVPHDICSLRPGQIELAGSTVSLAPYADKLSVVIGTPMGLVSDLIADDKYDALIIDEASQLRLSHALALCGHASQIIVAGDSRQLQPRDSEVGVVSENSLLARARLAGLPVVALERHYRSRHPSLIAWSNAFSYESKLRPNLGPYLLGDAGFDVVYVKPGRRLQRDLFQVNVEEAEAIAAECLKWARDGRRTVGVAALTQGQRDLIRETVERELGKVGLSAASAGPDNRFFSKEEPFFIRTAGAVQGEERDVMIVSLGVAPNLESKISQHTGALSRPDGLAVANVLLSRARLRTVVYSSVLPWEINLAAMTPGMFLIASMLRMATVVAAPDKGVSEPLPATFVSDEWIAHRLEVEGEPVVALVHRDIPDRYALGVCFLQNGHHGRAFAMLSQSGWDLEWDELSVLQRGSNTLRRDIDIALAKVLAAVDKKSEPATVQ